MKLYKNKVLWFVYLLFHELCKPGRPFLICHELEPLQMIFIHLHLYTNHIQTTWQMVAGGGFFIGIP
jgi:hypothetical protein